MPPISLLKPIGVFAAYFRPSAINHFPSAIDYMTLKTGLSFLKEHLRLSAIDTSLSAINLSPSAVETMTLRTGLNLLRKQLRRSAINVSSSAIALSLLAEGIGLTAKAFTPLSKA